MYRTYLVRLYSSIEEFFTDSDDIKVLSKDISNYIIIDSFGNNLTMHRESEYLINLTASGSSDPGFVLYFLIKKRNAKIMPMEVHKLLVKDARIKTCEKFSHVLDFNYKKATESFLKYYENLAYNSSKDNIHLINALNRINKSLKLQEERRYLTAISEIKRLFISLN